MDPKSRAKGPSKYSLLDSVDAVFEQNRRERTERLDNMRAKQASEQVHSQYLKSVLHPTDLADAKAVVGQWAKKHDKLGDASRRLLRQSIDASLSAVTSPRSRPVKRTQNMVGRTRSRWDMVGPREPREPTATTARVPAEPPKDVSTIVISDSEDSDEERQVELAIMLSLSESSKTAPATDMNSNLAGNEGRPDSSGDVNTVTVRDQQNSSSAEPVQEGNEAQTFRCSVLNCEAMFSSESGLEAHYARLCHSPCHPCLQLPDLKAPDRVLMYACPQCGQQFKEESKCNDHMHTKNHRAYLPGLAVCGYMCPQCLATFPDQKTCQEHMETFHHLDVTFPFEDDLLCLWPTPVPVSLGFLQDFTTECSKVEACLFCIDCCATIECNQCESHRKNNPMHIVSASGSRSLSDVFMAYLSSSQCDHCSVILSSHEGALGDVHTCGEGHVGKLRETKVRTFAEFVRLLGMKFAVQSVGELITLSATFNSSQASLVDSLQNCSMMSIERPADEVDQDTVRDEVVVNKPDSHTAKLCKKRRRSSVICLGSPEPGYEPKRKRTAETVDRPFLGGNSESNLRKLSQSPNITTIIGLVETVSIDQEKNTTVSMGMKNAPVSASTKNASVSTSMKSFPMSASMKSAPVSTSMKSAPVSTSMKSAPVSTSMKSAPVSTSMKSAPVSTSMKTAPVSTSVNYAPVPRPVGCFRTVKNATVLRRARGAPVSKGWRGAPPRTKIQGGEARTSFLPTVTSVPFPADAVFSSMNIYPNAVFPSPPDLSRPPPPLICGVSSRVSSGGPPSHQFLSIMKLVIFLDLDNWPSFFKRLPKCLPELTFVWAFWGGATFWREPYGFPSFTEQKRKGLFHLHKKSGRTKDAADVSLILQVGTMNALLPKSVPFTILSGDRGFCQVEKDLKDSQRRLVVIDPHRTNKHSSELFYTMIVSVLDS